MKGRTGASRHHLCLICTNKGQLEILQLRYETTAARSEISSSFKVNSKPCQREQAQSSAQGFTSTPSAAVVTGTEMLTVNITEFLSREDSAGQLFLAEMILPVYYKHRKKQKYAAIFLVTDAAKLFDCPKII